MKTIAPGSTIGILGGGQLGRMLGVAAAQLGYRVHVFAPAPGPACDIASSFTRADYDDAEALARFAADVDIVTLEFENVPVASVESIAATCPVLPGARALAVAQDRLAEKRFARSLGIATAPFAEIAGPGDFAAALAATGAPAILKTNRMGYDGKGQARIADPADLAAAWDRVGGVPCVLEGFVDFAAEYSVILARGSDGGCAFWDSPHNVHVNGILAQSTLPAPAIVAAQQGAARRAAQAIAEAIDYVGVLACEFFAGADGPVFNEMAPRVHNSGHWTIEGAVTSQFENHVRAICGLPLGSTAPTGAGVAMKNLIGEDANRWAELLADPDCHLHLYGKDEARKGRKMGHATWVIPPGRSP